MRVITLKRDSSPAALAATCGLCEKELMRINDIESSVTLPCGMSLALPAKDVGEKQGIELILSSPDRESDILPSAITGSVSIFQPGAKLQPPCDALSVLTVNNTDAQGILSPRLAHELFIDNDACEKLTGELAARLENEGWGGLCVNMEYLFPFDKAPYTKFLRKLEKSVHQAGCWLIVSVPASALLSPDSRSGAAYDVAALGGLCERIILTSGDIWTADSLERCISRFSPHLSPGRVLAGLKGQGSILRKGQKTQIPPAAAHNLALCAKARIYRENVGAPAEFDYVDAAGQLCHGTYTDALWFYGLSGQIKSLGLAGLFCPAVTQLSPAAKAIFDSFFYPETLI